MSNIWTKLIAVVLAFLAPIQAVLISITIFVIVDMITGMIAAHKRGETISSKKMRDSIGKMISYWLFILLAHLLDGMIEWDSFMLSNEFMVNIASGLIGLTEFKSCIENLDSIAGTNFFKSIKKFLAQNKNTKDIIDNIEDDNK